MTDDRNNTTKKMSDELRRAVENLTVFQKKYADYRARGLKQADASTKAGSKGSDRKSLTRVGYNTEQVPGVKDYIEHLIRTRAEAAMVDSVEVIDKLRRVYDEAIMNNKFSDANKAAELLGNMIGLFDKTARISKEEPSNKFTKNNVDAFKEEDESKEERMRKIKNLIKAVEDV